VEDKVTAAAAADNGGRGLGGKGGGGGGGEEEEEEEEEIPEIFIRTDQNTFIFPNMETRGRGA